MQTQDLCQLLKNNEYPGRGIVLGVDETGKNAVIVYFIMGRSVNSRNRVFEETADGIITKAYDESKMVDPHLIIYAPVRDLGDGRVIVTNGDQTDTIRDFLLSGKSFEDALRTRTFEDDPPILTPRVSGLLELRDHHAAYRLSILKSDEHDEKCAQRYFFDYPQPQAGVGHFIHTYRCNGNPAPSFEGEPEKVTLKGDIEQLSLQVWDALNEDNKVALYVSFIDLESGESDSIIINRHDQETPEC